MSDRRSEDFGLEQIQNFNDEYADDAYDSIFIDEVVPLRGAEAVEEKRCNNRMIMTVFILAIISCAFICWVETLCCRIVICKFWTSFTRPTIICDRYLNSDLIYCLLCNHITHSQVDHTLKPIDSTALWIKYSIGAVEESFFFSTHYLQQPLLITNKSNSTNPIAPTPHNWNMEIEYNHCTISRYDPTHGNYKFKLCADDDD